MNVGGTRNPLVPKIKCQWCKRLSDVSNYVYDHAKGVAFPVCSHCRQPLNG